MKNCNEAKKILIFSHFAQLSEIAGSFSGSGSEVFDI